MAAFWASIENGGNVLPGPEAWFERSAWTAANRDAEISGRGGNARGYLVGAAMCSAFVSIFRSEIRKRLW